MISGFFTYGKNGLNDVIRKRIIGQLKILCWGVGLYFIVSLIKEGPSAVEKMQHFLTPSFFMFNTLPYGGHLWYIIAYIYILVIMLFVEKYNLYKPLFIITPILLVGTIAIGTYSEIFLSSTFPVPYSRNFLFTGLPFFSLGMIVKHFKPALSTPLLITSMIMSYILGLAEVHYLGVFGGDCYLSTIFLSASTFLLFLNIKQPKDTLFSKIGREDGLYIYVLHFIIANFTNKYSAQVPILLYISTPLVLLLTLLLIDILKKTKVIGKLI